MSARVLVAKLRPLQRRSPHPKQVPHGYARRAPLAPVAHRHRLRLQTRGRQAAPLRVAPAARSAFGLQPVLLLSQAAGCRWSPDFSSWFNNPEDADMLLHLSTADPAADTAEHARTYHAHAVLLRAGSDYFQT